MLNVSNPIQVQPYSTSYQSQVVALIIGVQQEFGVPIALADQPDLQNIPAVYQTPNGNFWLALDYDRVVGTIALIDLGNQQAAIRKMFVYPEYRGQPHRTGQMLLNRLMEWASHRAIAELYLGTTAFLKAAHRFYEKNGFIEIQPTALPACFPIMQVDSKFYHYRLN